MRDSRMEEISEAAAQMTCPNCVQTNGAGDEAMRESESTLICIARTDQALPSHRVGQQQEQECQSIEIWN